MSYVIKKNSGATAKFRALAIDSNKCFVDTDTGKILDFSNIIAKTFGEDTPVDISVSNKSEDDITPEE